MAWANNVGNLWRTTGDIDDKWEGKFDYKSGIMTIVDSNELFYPFAGPGHWNDPDMLEVGNGALSPEEYRTHFSLWAMMAAPLIAGNDIVHMSEETKSILLNREVIRIDQDRLGHAGHRVRKDGSNEVRERVLGDGSRAVILLNRGETPTSISVAWHEVDLPDKLPLQVRDLWKKQEVGSFRASFTADSVPPHGVVMITLKP